MIALIAPRKLTGFAVLACAALFLPGRSVEAGTVYTFKNISNNSGVSNTLGGQFTVEVIGKGDPNLTLYPAVTLTDTQVLFVFKNAVGTASSITDIYFHDAGSVLSNLTTPVYESAGVDFEPNANPGDLPGGNTITPKFVTTNGFSADSSPPAAPNGVNAASEWVALRFNLASGKTLNDVLSSLNNPVTGDTATGLRIGLHVQAIGQYSDSFVNTPDVAAVPVPPSFVLMAIGGLGVLGIVRRRRKPA
jgi:hypothetical protein